MLCDRISYIYPFGYFGRVQQQGVGKSHEIILRDMYVKSCLENKRNIRLINIKELLNENNKISEREI